MSEIIPFHQITDADGEQVGGKGLSLGLLARAGLPVPDGFVLSTAAYRWLRGESVVSGRVAPDRYQVDHDTGVVLDRQISNKRTMRTAAGEQPVPVEKQTAACLDDVYLRELAELGHKVEALYGGARDIEW